MAKAQLATQLGDEPTATGTTPSMIWRLWELLSNTTSLEGSTFLRLLSMVGTALAFLGGLASLISGALFANRLHDQYVTENVIILILAIGAGIATWHGRLRSLGYIGWALLLVVLACLGNEISLELQAATPRPGMGSGFDIFATAVKQSFVSLWQSHIGWSFLIFAFVILVAVGNRASSYSFYAEMERKRAFRMGQVISPRDEVLSEIANAPLWPLAWGTIFILSGIIILFAGADVSLGRKMLGALVSELGFAFFIAYVLSISLEIHAKRRHDRQVSRSLLSVVYGTNLDKKLFSDTETYIFKSAFYRRDVMVEYDFLRVQGDWMLLKYVLSYTVENVSSGSATYGVEAHVEKIEDRDELLDPDTVFGLYKIYVDGKALTDAQMEKARSRIEDDDKYIKSRHLVPLKPGQQKTIRTVHITARMTRDGELWRSLIPCASLAIRVRWSKDIDLEVKAEPVHPCGAFKFEELDKRSFFATIDQPLFPHNGVQIWWKPIKGNGANSAVKVGGRKSPRAAAPEKDAGESTPPPAPEEKAKPRRRPRRRITTG